MRESELVTLLKGAQRIGAPVEWYFIEGCRGALYEAKKLHEEREKERQEAQREREREEYRRAMDEFRHMMQEEPQHRAVDGTLRGLCGPGSPLHWSKRFARASRLDSEESFPVRSPGPRGAVESRVDGGRGQKVEDRAATGATGGLDATSLGGNGGRSCVKDVAVAAIDERSEVGSLDKSTSGTGSKAGGLTAARTSTEAVRPGLTGSGAIGELAHEAGERVSGPGKVKTEAGTERANVGPCGQHSGGKKQGPGSLQKGVRGDPAGLDR